MPQSKLFFSIVIPSLNEEKFLPNLLKDLANQTFGKDRFEVIHVDGNSDDKTVQQAAKSKNTLNLASYVVKKRNVAYQRNFGGKKAKGNWIIFMDADDRLPDYFLDGIHYQLIKDQTIDFFTCSFQPNVSNRINNLASLVANIMLELTKDTSRPLFPGAVFGVKKSIATKHAMNERLKVSEDMEYAKRLIKAGYSAQVFHDPFYFFHMRRLKKMGLVKMSKISATLTIADSLKRDLTKNNYGYEMRGGIYYTQQDKKYFSTISQLVNNLPKKQIEQIKKVARLIFYP